MPLYTYLCKKCSKKFDFLVGMTQEKLKVQCPFCGNTEVEKVFAPFRIVSSGRGGSSKCSSCSGGDCSTCS